MIKTNRKNTTKKTVSAESTKPGIASTKPAAKVDAPVKTYTSFGGILTAQSRKTLPRGLKAKVDGANILFATAKLGTVAVVPVAEFALGELKRHGFSVIT